VLAPIRCKARDCLALAYFHGSQQWTWLVSPSFIGIEDRRIYVQYLHVEDRHINGMPSS
jgi:hypothetical protein